MNSWKCEFCREPQDENNERYFLDDMPVCEQCYDDNKSDYPTNYDTDELYDQMKDDGMFKKEMK